MYDTTTKNTKTGGSVLASLRSLMPANALNLRESIATAEHQAQRLLELRAGDDAPIDTRIVTELPRVTLEGDPTIPRMAVSGAAHWSHARKTWIITVNPDEPRTRQRMTVLHEFKHIIDHGHPGLTGPLPRTIYGYDPAEFIAEYFAGCVLIPQRVLKRAWYQGIQDLDQLAQIFDVSPRALQVRLGQVGLADDCGTPASQLPTFWPRPRTSPLLGCARKMLPQNQETHKMKALA